MDNIEESKTSSGGWVWNDQAERPKPKRPKLGIVIAAITKLWTWILKTARRVQNLLNRKSVLILCLLPFLIGTVGYAILDGSFAGTYLFLAKTWAELQKNGGKVYDKFFPSPPVSPKPSKLLIEATPGADVYLNGSFKGNTPFALTNLTAGEYVIELKNPDFADSLRQEFIWKSNGRDTTISYVFQVRKACALVVTAMAGTEVFIDQQAYGATDNQSKLVLQDLAPGKYKVKLVKPEIWGMATKDVELKIGEEAKVSYAWSTGSLVVNATPWGIVYIDDRRVDETPLTKDIAVGKHRLKVVREGLPDFVQNLIIKKNEPTEISVE